MLAPLLLMLACRQNTDVILKIDATRPSGSISPYIYGSNEDKWDGSCKDLTFGRQGGNRMTAYNWENNASNAGNDWHNQNDNFLGGGDIPGEVTRSAVAAALADNASFLVTIPMAGYVAADKKGDGDVNQTPNYLDVRFKKSLPKKNAPFIYPPNLNDDTVYQDEFVTWLEKKFANRPKGANIWYSLDNEPDLWASTHSRIHPKPLTYAEIVERSTDYAEAIKAVAPKTLVFGLVSYGWDGYVVLQHAPDGQGRDFLNFFLTSMKSAEEKSGKRLMDVLDLHWYPEAQGGGKRITEQDTSPAIVKARMQATRSLWDPTYVEDSWITKTLGGKGINLLPRIKEKIEKNYPGTKLAFTEYTYGGAAHISGAIAEADALGIFGRQGIFAAAYWPVQQDNSFVHAAMDAYRNYDGHNAIFGDQALEATSTDPTQVSIYASSFSKDKGKMVCVIVNQSDTSRSCVLAIGGMKTNSDRQFTLSGDQPKLKESHFAQRQGDGMTLTLEPMSVNVLELKR